MSATVMNIETLLEGKYYRSNSRGIDWIIQEANHAPELWYENAEAYKVRVRPTYNGVTLEKDFWATVCVSNA